MTTSNGGGAAGDLADEDPRAHSRPAPVGSGEPAVSARRQMLGGLLAGIAAGCGMYAVLAVAAIGQGRGASYPLHAVHALLAGKRVLPDHPAGSLYGPQAFDWFFAPLYFFLPALALGLFTAYRVARRGATANPWRAAAVPAAAGTALFFIVFVVIVALPEATPSMQRSSSGHGVRALGVLAWGVAHLVYLALLVVLLGPLTRASAHLRRRDASRVQ